MCLQPGGDCSLLAPKENQKGRRCPEGMKAPVGLLSRRPVCEANAACLARQGHGDFDVLAAGRGLFSFGTKREPERTAVPGGHESPSGAFKPQTGLRSKCRVFSAARARRFRRAGADGLRHPASASCLGRHSHPAGRCPNSSSLHPPQAAVVAVAHFSRFSDLKSLRDGRRTTAAKCRFPLRPPSREN